MQNEFSAINFPKELVHTLRFYLGEEIRFRRIDAHRQRSCKWICSGRDCRQSLVIKHLDLKESREAFIYEQVVQTSNLPAPRFLAAIKEEAGTWLIIDYIKNETAVSERDFSDIARTIATLHKNKQALILLAKDKQIPKASLRYAAVVERSLKSLEALYSSKYVNSTIRQTSQRLIQLADWGSEAAWLAKDAMVPVHGNLHIGNVLLQWQVSFGNNRVLLIDWPDMMIGSPLEDLGTLIADVPARLDLISEAYSTVTDKAVNKKDLLRAFHFQLFVEVAWRAELVRRYPEGKEVKEFYRRASLFGI